MDEYISSIGICKNTNELGQSLDHSANELSPDPDPTSPNLQLNTDDKNSSIISLFGVLLSVGIFALILTPFAMMGSLYIVIGPFLHLIGFCSLHFVPSIVFPVAFFLFKPLALSTLLEQSGLADNIAYN